MRKSSHLIWIFILVFLSNSILAEAEPDIQWETLVGGPSYFHWGTGVDQTTDGGYVVVGYIDTTGTGAGGFNKIYLAKLTPAGRIEWSKSIGDSSKETSGTFVQQTKDGGYIIAGTIDQMEWGTPTSKYLVKTGPQGNIEWTKTFGEAIASGNTVYQTKDEGYIFAAGSILYKTDSSGNQQWSKLYSYPVMHARQTRDEGYILVTGTLAIKLNITGIAEWSYDLGYTANSAQETSDGGYIATGGAMSLTKINSDGIMNWTKNLGPAQWKEGRSVQETFDGGYIVAGTTRTVDNIDVYVVRTDGQGNQQWEKKIGSPEVARGDYGYHIERCDDGGYVVVGASDKAGLDGVSDVYVIKIAPDTVPPLDPAEFIVYDLVIDPDSVEIGEDITFYVTVENIGDETGSHPFSYQIDDMIVYNSSVTLGGGEFTTVSYVTSFEVNGTYSVSVDGLSDTFRVRGPGEPYVPPEPEPEPAPIPEPEPETEPEEEKILTNLVFHVAKDRMYVDDVSTFSGYITPVIFGASIEIRSVLEILDESREDSIYVTTMLDGSFSGEISFPEEGIWEVWAFWSGNSEYESARASQYVKIGRDNNSPPIPSFPLLAIIIGLLVIVYSHKHGHNHLINNGYPG